MTSITPAGDSRTEGAACRGRDGELVVDLDLELAVDTEFVLCLNYNDTIKSRHSLCVTRNSVLFMSPGWIPSPLVTRRI